MHSVDVLIVDDDGETRELMAMHLREAGLVVETAAGGEEALDKLVVSNPQVIVADVSMPNVGGYELCRRVRSMGCDDLPLILWSALGDARERVAGLRAGADDYVAKTADPDELVLRVKKQLDRRTLARSHDRITEAPVSRSRPSGGSLNEVSVADLLRTLDFYGLRDACLRLQGQQGMTGEIEISYRCAVRGGDDSFADGATALAQLLGWRVEGFRIREHEPVGREPDTPAPPVRAA